MRPLTSIGSGDAARSGADCPEQPDYILNAMPASWLINARLLFTHSSASSSFVYDHDALALSLSSFLSLDL